MENTPLQFCLSARGRNEGADGREVSNGDDDGAVEGADARRVGVQPVLHRRWSSVARCREDTVRKISSFCNLSDALSYMLYVAVVVVFKNVAPIIFVNG